ncbi:MAG: MBOAT family protein [Oscillospiraceae bacterium]|nr:MBOAT family protein [Oscillospiraceae bacterium]
MIFSNIFFLFRFLPVVLLIYYRVPYKYKNGVITIASLIFYSWGEVKYFPIMIASTVVDFFSSQYIERHRGDKSRMRQGLACSVMFNLGCLMFFKYTDFFISNINAFTGTSIPLLRIPLPLGISFYTFQTMSYTIDVYRGKVDAEKNIINFSAFVTMFPQLIAGPIVLYSDIREKLNTHEGRITLEGINEGIKLFILGVGKKVLIANNVGALWTDIETMGFAAVSTPLAWLGIVAYSLQIYFDFSGYSLMAIGLGKMLGFDFPQNFNLPYISKSITEFWRRWHMTLSGWFREYVYIPLGGNRKGLKRQILNMLVVWFLTGFWHGADWNFMLWGLYYFALLTIEKVFLLKWLKEHPVPARVYTLLAIAVGWAIFYITDLPSLGGFIIKMFSFTDGVGAGYYLRNYAASIAVGILCSTTLTTKFWEKYKNNNLVMIPLLTVIFLISVAYLVDSTYNPFIYFRF